MKSKIYRAGLIPYFINNDEIEMMFMKPSDSRYGGSDFQIAKGKVENGESFEEAAIREAGEELGFTTLNSDGNIKDLGTFLGRTRIFVVKIKNKEMFTKPHFETSNTKWMTEDKFLSNGRKLHAPIIQSAIRLIKRNL